MYEVVGRDAELAEIGRWLDSGSGLLLIEGEPGIGKTTLWRAGVEAALERGRAVLHARPAEAERDLSFSGLGDLLRSALDSLQTLPAPRRRALESALLLSEDNDLGAPDARAVGLATLDLIRALAEKGPLVVAIDDTQWLDPPSRQTLEYVLRRLEDEPIAFLTACRPGGALTSTSNQASIILGPLSLGSLHELIRARSNATPTRPTLVRIHDTSGGNPFFALELMLALEGRELRPGDPLPVPATLSELAAARFADLDPETCEVLLYVATMARPTRGVVADAAGEGASAALDVAAAAGVVDTTDARLRFAHPLLSSVHYGSASPDQRARVHRRLAEVVTDAEERARHLALAADGPDQQAAEALDDAANRAHRRGAVWAAAELSELARQLTPDDQPEAWYSRTIHAGVYAFEVGDAARAQDLFETALGNAHSRAQRGEALRHLGTLQEYRGDRRRALELYRKGLVESGEDELLLRAQLEQGVASALSLLRQELLEAADHARVGVALAEKANDRLRLSIGLGIQGLIDVLLGRDEWRATMQAGVDLEGEGDPAPIAEGAPLYLAAALIWVDEFDEARAICHSLLDRERVEDSGLPWVLADLALADFYLGNWVEAVVHADEAIDVALQTSQEPQRLLALAVRAVVRAARGEVEDAKADAEAVLLPAEDHGVMVATILAVTACGLIDIVSGKLEEADQLLGPLVRRLERGGVREPGSARFITDEIEVLVGLGRLNEAEALVEQVEARATALDRASVLAACVRCRGLLAAAGGDLSGALVAFERALHEHDRCPVPFERGRTLLALGRTERQAKMKRRARDTLEAARGVFETLGARTWAELASSEIARIGGRALAAGDELSETEKRIAELVSEGRSNKEVAAALSLSPKTVEWNLSKIYAKLGVRSRTELARRRP